MAPRDSQLGAPSTDPRLARKIFSGRAGAGGPGGAPFELRIGSRHATPHRHAGPSTEASNQRHLLRVKGSGWPGQQMSLSVTGCWQRSSAHS